MAAVRASLLVLALVALVKTQASTAPAPFSPPQKVALARKAKFARMRLWLAEVGMTWSWLEWKEHDNRWEFACFIAIPYRSDLEWFFSASSDDVDGLEAIELTIHAIQKRF